MSDDEACARRSLVMKCKLYFRLSGARMTESDRETIRCPTHSLGKEVVQPPSPDMLRFPSAVSTPVSSSDIIAMENLRKKASAGTRNRPGRYGESPCSSFAICCVCHTYFWMIFQSSLANSLTLSPGSRSPRQAACSVKLQAASWTSVLAELSQMRHQAGGTICSTAARGQGLHGFVTHQQGSVCFLQASLGIQRPEQQLWRPPSKQPWRRVKLIVPPLPERLLTLSTPRKKAAIPHPCPSLHMTSLSLLLWQARSAESAT